MASEATRPAALPPAASGAHEERLERGAWPASAAGSGCGSGSGSSSNGSAVSANGSKGSASEQVITSLQANSKKAPLPAAGAEGRTAGEARQSGAAGGPASRGRPTVLDPSGSLYYHWSLVVSFAFLYNFWSLSYRFAFREIDFDTVAFWFAFDYSADLIYVIDIVINFRTGYLEDGVLQENMDKIGLHYRESTLFYLDCFCLLPLDILYLSISFNSILRCTRLAKIYKFWSLVDRTERHTNYPNVFRTFTLVHYLLVIFHWNACLFHMISKNKLIDMESLYRIQGNRCDDTLCQYLHAFYWSTLALTTIGDLPRPRTKGEYFYISLELFFGLFLFASVLGHVANIVTNVSAERKEFQAKLDAVKTFMRMRRVSEELQNKVIRWFDYLWVSQKSSDEDRSVACLPDRLKAEIAIHVHLDTLKRVDIFQNTEAGFLCELVLRLKPVLFSPGDYVCRKNEVGHEMYIVSRGILEVVTEEGRTVATLKAGSYFGEISVLNVGLAGNKRTASVRSVGYSDLFCLNKQDLWDVLKNYPNAETRIRARAEERLSKLDISQQLGAHSTFKLKSARVGPELRDGSHRRRLCSASSNCNKSYWNQAGRFGWSGQHRCHRVADQEELRAKCRGFAHSNREPLTDHRRHKSRLEHEPANECHRFEPKKDCSAESGAPADHPSQFACSNSHEHLQQHDSAISITGTRQHLRSSRDFSHPQSQAVEEGRSLERAPSEVNERRADSGSPSQGGGEVLGASNSGRSYPKLASLKAERQHSLERALEVESGPCDVIGLQSVRSRLHSPSRSCQVEGAANFNQQLEQLNWTQGQQLQLGHHCYHRDSETKLDLAPRGASSEVRPRRSGHKHRHHESCSHWRPQRPLLVLPPTGYWIPITPAVGLPHLANSLGCGHQQTGATLESHQSVSMSRLHFDGSNGLANQQWMGPSIGMGGHFEEQEPARDITGIRMAADASELSKTESPSGDLCQLERQPQMPSGGASQTSSNASQLGGPLSEDRPARELASPSSSARSAGGWTF